MGRLKLHSGDGQIYFRIGSFGVMNCVERLRPMVALTNLYWTSYLGSQAQKEVGLRPWSMVSLGNLAAFHILMVAVKMQHWLCCMLTFRIRSSPRYSQSRRGECCSLKLELYSTSYRLSVDSFNN